MDMQLLKWIKSIAKPEHGSAIKQAVVETVSVICKVGIRRMNCMVSKNAKEVAVSFMLVKLASVTLHSDQTNEW